MPFSTLMYHEIRTKDSFHPGHPSAIQVRQDYQDVLPPVLFVTYEQFLEQMKYLKDHNYHTLTLYEVKDFYYHGKPLPKHSVLLTFDDCYQSMKQYAYPVLKSCGFHAAAFVVSHWLKEKPMDFQPEHSVCMAESELYEMDDVFEFANHTDSFHQRLDAKTSMMMTAGDEEFSDDLIRCNACPVVQHKDVFAYPFGLYEERNVDLLKHKGFQLAFTTQNGQNDESTDPFLLKRNAVPFFMDLDAFKKLL